jgi:DNA (cytosine-5)-methyltransferase 1
MKLFDHATPRLSELEERMISGIPPGGSWQEIPAGLSARVDQIRARSAARGLVHTTYYGRLAWDRPAYTINTYFSRIGNGAFLHPGQLRLISLREGARLQSFPDRVRFSGPRRSQYQQIGNAVPPLLAYAVANSLPPGIVADLFAGAGGLSLGFQMAGHKVVYAADHSPHAVATYNAAHGNEVARVRNLGDPDVRKQVTREVLDQAGGSPDLVLAGPPCQGFSTAGHRNRMDSRSAVFWAAFEVAKALRPQTLLIENVQGILSIAERSMPGKIMSEMRALGLEPAMAVLHAEEHGVPQRRTRVFFVGVREGTWEPPDPVCARKDPSVMLPAPFTVRDAISDLPPLVPGQELDDIELDTDPESIYQQWARGQLGAEELVSERQRRGERGLAPSLA